jgi:hypothetical protein
MRSPAKRANAAGELRTPNGRGTCNERNSRNPAYGGHAVSQGNRDSASTGAAFKVHSRAAGRRKPRRNGSVESSQLSPLAEELAEILSCGNRARWQIISTTKVIVVNRPRGGRKP